MTHRGPRAGPAAPAAAGSTGLAADRVAAAGAAAGSTVPSPSPEPAAGSESGQATPSPCAVPRQQCCVSGDSPLCCRPVQGPLPLDLIRGPVQDRPGGPGLLAPPLANFFHTTHQCFRLQNRDRVPDDGGVVCVSEGPKLRRRLGFCITQLSRADWRPPAS